MTQAVNPRLIDAESIRLLKHELRTPVNHIVGYSELLAEAAADAGEEELTRAARTMHEGGCALAELFEKHWSTSAEEMDLSQMNALGKAILPTVQRIEEEASVAARITSSDACAADVGRIRQAIHRLTTIQELGLIPSLRRT
jgi:light-regulated signal transduction histidine kinase (bacteriophytochrome)